MSDDQARIAWEEEWKMRTSTERNAIRRLVASCEASDFVNFYNALVYVDGLCIHREAFLKLAHTSPPTAKFRRLFFEYAWGPHGDHIRQEVGDDLLLCDVLRILMPPYRGPARQLYRGETAVNRRRRTYSISWTSSRVVAEAFAQDTLMRRPEGGSVLLETVAPANAIISKVTQTGRFSGEREYLVDRRHLANVHVVARYSQIPF